MTATPLRPVALPLGDDIFWVRPDLDLILEIEDELGSLPDLQRRFAEGRWTAGEAITLLHMLLARAGKNTDWRELGQAVLISGLDGYRPLLLDFLTQPLTGLRAA